MCGINAYIGQRDVVPLLVNGLKRLEYRGYDSCGIAVMDNNQLKVVKIKGKIVNLEAELAKEKEIRSNIGIAHTRWATHGEPTTVNAHPHTDCKEEIALVHNGIIENFETLKKFLEEKGHKFKSETDTEVLVHLVEHFYSGDLKAAVLKALREVIGSFGIAVINKDKEEIVIARRGSPIIIGIGKDQKEFFVSSDVSAIIEYTNDVIYLDDNEVCKITKDNYEITSLQNISIDKEITNIQMSIDEIEKKGYKHFMLKEIFEESETFRQAISGRINVENLNARLGGINKDLTKEYLEQINRIIIIGCGTSWHCGLVAKYFMEHFLRIPVEVDYASEFRYRDPIIDKNTLVIAISQSGETADTLAALREAKGKGAKVIGIVNVAGSTIARECDCGIYIRAGPEIGVASTKAFINQLVCLNLLTLFVGRTLGKIDDKDANKLIVGLQELPKIFEDLLKHDEKIKDIAKKYYNSKNMLYLGRGINFPIALEGALKLKEISYIHAEGNPAAEMKHGLIALIDKDYPVIVIANQDMNYDKVISNIHEAKARGAKIIAIATEGDEEIAKLCDDIIYVPNICLNLSPFVNVIPLQLFAYHVADLRGCSIDQPRNLAKCVTVE